MRKSKSVVTLRSATASLNPGTLWKTRTCLSPEVINHLFSASKTLSKINDSYYINDGSPRLNKDTVYEHFDIAFRTCMLRQVRRIGSLLDLNWNRLDCFTHPTGVGLRSNFHSPVITLFKPSSGEMSITKIVFLRAGLVVTELPVIYNY